MVLLYLYYVTVHVQEPVHVDTEPRVYKINVPSVWYKGKKKRNPEGFLFRKGQDQALAFSAFSAFGPFEGTR